jgi:hypothetical protein
MLEAGDFVITPTNPKTIIETKKSAVKKRKVKDLLDFSSIKALLFKLPLMVSLLSPPIPIQEPRMNCAWT